MSDQDNNDEHRPLSANNQNMMLMMYCTNPADRLDDDLPMNETKKKSTTTTAGKKRKMTSSSKRSARSQSSENRQRRLSHKEGESHLTHVPSSRVSTNGKSQPRAIEWAECDKHTTETWTFVANGCSLEFHRGQKNEIEATCAILVQRLTFLPAR